MPNSIEFYKRIFLYVIPARIIIPCYFNISNQNTQYFDGNPRFSIEILRISIEILGFPFEILGISKICHYHIPYRFFRNCFCRRL